MGSIYFGVPEELTNTLREAAGARVFIETGTYLGDTAAWAARHFERVITIEASPELHGQARERHGGLPNIEFLLGDSRALLGELLASIESPAILWLDSHWSGGVTAGRDDECPLLQELAVIAPMSTAHVILIDDARLFLAPPMSPHSIDAWPTIGQVLGALGDGRYTIVLEDVIVSVPPPLRASVLPYARAVADRNR